MMIKLSYKMYVIKVKLSCLDFKSIISDRNK